MNNPANNPGEPEARVLGDLAEFWLSPLGRIIWFCWTPDYLAWKFHFALFHANLRLDDAGYILCTLSI